MNVQKLPAIVATLEQGDHPYLNGAWAPLHEEVNAFDLDLIEGAIPRDLDGVYLRNTQNQIHQPLGFFHPFDGDSMLHQIDLQKGKANYRNRWVRTRGFSAEQEAECSLWGGFVDAPSLSYRKGYGFGGALKDASSTDIIVHAGMAMSLFYMNGEGYRLDALTLETLGIEGWVPVDGISAHAKVNENTGELYFFNYTVFPPFAHFGVVDKHNKLVSYRPVPLAGPRVVHDMAYTKNYAILADFPLLFDNEGKMAMHWEMPSRFGLIPRNNDSGDVRWFEGKPTFVQHWLNAYEDGDEVVLDGYFQEDPLPAVLPKEYPADVAPAFAILHVGGVRTKLYRWRFNLITGETQEECLDKQTRTNLEFGVFNQGFAGHRYRYAYSNILEPDMFLMSGWVKHDLDTGDSWTLKLPEGVYCSESPFARRIGAVDEDDGYLISFITDENKQTSECWIIDARRIEVGPVARLALPHKIKSGTHACWASREQVAGRSPATKD